MNTRNNTSAVITRRRRALRGAMIETLETRQLLSLVIDLRLPGGGKTANISSVGQVINYEIWATAKGNNGSGSDEGLQIAIGSLLSTNVNGGAANGTLAAKATSPFNALGSQAGSKSDLDGDGDSDVGSNDNNDGGGFFAARSGSVEDSGTVSGNSQSWLVGKGTFTVTSLKSGGTTNLVWRVRNYDLAALWREDNGTLRAPANGGSYQAGAPLVLTRGTVSSGATVTGTVFNDANKNNAFDGSENGLSGVKVFLDTNKNGVADSGEKTATTDSSGSYAFSGLSAGSYRVREVAPGNFKITNPSTSYFDVTLSTNQTLSGKNFANQSTSTGGSGGSITGTVFSDTNKNGVKDGSEGVLSGKKMFIDANKNGKLDSGEKTATTSSAGVYTFTGLAAGTYEIRRGDTPTGTGYSNPASGFYDVTLSSKQVVTGKNFGMIPSGSTGSGASIAGTVFSDTNKNGSINTGESVLSGKKMFIDANKNGKLDSGEKTATTNAQGIFTFSGLAAGTYRIRRSDTPSGTGFSTPSSGFYDITVTANQKVTGKNFGMKPL